MNKYQNHRISRPFVCLTIIVASLASHAGLAQEQEHPDRLLWGDTHLHTNLSVDAYFLENTTADAHTAYRFAKGLPVIHPYHRAKVQIETPLDFLAVTDHAGLLGVPYSLLSLKDERLAKSRLGKRLVSLYEDGRKEDAFGLFLMGVNSGGLSDDERPPKVNALTLVRWKIEDLFGEPDHAARAYRWIASDPSLLDDLLFDDIFQSHWAYNVAAADAHNDPGNFTTLVGWEYTPTTNGENLHRVVMTPVGGDQATSFLPYSSRDSANPEDLWAWLASTRENTGIDFVSIPHNSNISKGQMFSRTTMSGEPIDEGYARLRSDWEPVAEVTQIKGTSETHPLLSPTDEFAGFEFFNALIDARSDTPARPDVSEADYVRSALKIGLEVENEVGVNPYKLGMIGSTDSHSGLATAEEHNFMGKMAIDSTPENKAYGLAGLPGWEMSASGLAAVWAKENTRDEIFAAFKRREVYGTTGPRIALRFFGGFDFADEDHEARNLAAVGYEKGVPMGGDLAQAPQSPSFLVRAVKDPKSANLDRIQIVKGWIGDDGTANEKVYNVAWSGNRTLRGDGTLPLVGDTVDRQTAFYSNTIGAPELSAVWRDPDFDPNARSFYYVRVLQIPTPRNSLYDSVALNATPPDGYPEVIQERAYSSPIWYTP